MKNIVLKFSILFFFFISKVFATAPGVVCNELPWCNATNIGGTSFFTLIWNIIANGIKYVAVISVLSLMIAGMMYLTSGWEEEGVKKAKKWIIWALVWVFISTSAWAIINLVNKFTI